MEWPIGLTTSASRAFSCACNCEVLADFDKPEVEQTNGKNMQPGNAADLEALDHLPVCASLGAISGTPAKA